MNVGGGVDWSRKLGPLVRWELVWLVVLSAAGVIGRLAWLIFMKGELGVAGGEVQYVAASVMRSGTVADVFGRGSGLTAHVNPLLPVFAGTLYRAFGWGSPAAELILTSVALISIFGAAVLFYLTFRQLEVPIIPCLIAFGLFCILPLNLHFETVGFRIWEGGIAALILSSGLHQLVVLDGRPVIRLRRIFAVAFLAAMGMFINPAVGLTLYVGALLFMRRNFSLRQAISATAIAAVVLIIVLSPWTIRNALAFERFIPLRSNYGLEIALANHPGVASGRDDATVFIERWQELHPLATSTAFDRMNRMGGEQEYAIRLGQQAKEWIKTNPAEAVRVSIKHAFQFYFPPPWQYELWGARSRGTVVKSFLTSLITFIGLLGGAAAAVVIRRRWIYPLSFLIVPVLPYLLVQPTSRYHYLISTLTIFMALGSVAALFMRFRRAGAGPVHV